MTFELRYNNAKSLLIIANQKIDVIKENKTITDVKIDYDTIISLNDQIPIILYNNEREISSFYIVNNIKLLKNNKCIIYEFPTTFTEELLLPLLELSKNELLYNYDFCGAYNKVNSLKYNHIKEIFYLIYRWNPFDYYNNFIANLKTLSIFVNKFKSTDNRFDIIAVKPKEIYHKDIKYILKSKYLDLSVKAKYKIFTFNKSKRIKDTIGNNLEYRKALEKKLNAKIPDDIPLYPKFNLDLCTYKN